MDIFRRGIELLTNLTNLTITNSSLNSSTPVLTGEIPKQIGNLTNLQILDLNGNNLTGPIPTQIGTIGTLTYLDLADNALTGTIDTNPIFSSNLANLTYLSFANNKLTGELPNPSTDMTRLQELNLSGNQLSGAVPANFSVARFPEIVNINLSHNNLSGTLTNRFITENITLQYLDLSYNSFSGTVPDYSPNQRIIYLNLSYNRLTGFDSSTLFKKTSIKYLYLNDNPLGNTSTTFTFGPGNSAKATTEVINISNTGITSIGQIPNDMQGSLREFYSSGNGLTSIPSGITNCSNLEKLDLSNNTLTTLPSLTNFIQLKYLNISKNRITTIAANYFVNNANLEEIYINDNIDTSGVALTGTLPTISHLTKLQIFDASNNNFSGNFPNLSTNTTLKVFNISSNKFSGTIPSTIEVLTNLVELNISNNEFVGSLSSWLKELPSFKRDRNFFVTTEPSQKTITPEIVYLDLLQGETITLPLKADVDTSYTYSSTSIWDITGSSGSGSVATVTSSGSTLTIRGVGTGSAEFVVGLQGRDTSKNDNAQMIIRINTIEVNGVLIRYAERNNTSNVIYQEIIEDIPNGTVYSHTAPETYNSNGEWVRDSTATQNVTVSNGYGIITVLYDKVMSPLTITYLEQGSNPINTLKTITTTAQVGSTYIHNAPTYYTKPENVAEGEYRIVGGQTLSKIITSSSNTMIINYEKNMSYDQVIIRYIFIDPITGIYEVDLVPLGYYQVGTSIYYRLPSTYMRNGIWQIDRENLDINHTVLQTGNTITVECNPMMTNTNQIVIRYVNEANTSQIIQTVSPNPSPQQKGSTYTFNVPETLNISGQDWSVVYGTTQSVLIADNTTTQYINVLYRQGLTKYDVTINYVEKGNTGHLLEGEDLENPKIVGQRQVGDNVTFTAPETIDHDGELWKIVGPTTRTETVRFCELSINCRI